MAEMVHPAVEIMNPEAPTMNLSSLIKFSLSTKKDPIIFDRYSQGCSMSTQKHHCDVKIESLLLIPPQADSSQPESPLLRIRGCD
mmetsp:Transcript_21145/g.38275  ORF Transcript_21145/g.38275 Transcript_21145/m.38275 type:complete len:85 (-) Transcript_21145:94-348(-)